MTERPGVEQIGWEEFRKQNGWPTPNHMRHTADALGVLTPAKYGDVLRWVADACDDALDALRAATPAPPEPATKPPMDDDCPDFCSRWPSCGHTEADFNVPPLRAATPAPPEPGLHSLAHDAVSAWSHYFDGDRAGYWKPLCEAMDALAVETRKPAPSGPALDVERLYAAIRRIAMREGHPGHHDLRSGLTTPGLGHGYEITLAGAIAEEYTRGA